MRPIFVSEYQSELSVWEGKRKRTGGQAIRAVESMNAAKARELDERSLTKTEFATAKDDLVLND